MEDEEGDEEDFFDNDDKNSQTGFSEYLVKGQTIASAAPPKQKKKGKQKQTMSMMNGDNFLGPDDGLKKRESKVAGLDTLS